MNSNPPQDQDRDNPERPDRRQALGCLAAWTGSAIVWSVVGGIPQAFATSDPNHPAAVANAGFSFVQISDTHIGFNKAANPDVVGSLRRAMGEINALPTRPALVVHTGDVSHLSKPEQFGQARELFQELKVDRVHTIPGEHDALDDGLNGYLKYFDHDGKGRAWYSFDQGGVHFIGLSNVLNFTMGTMTSLGDAQIAWLRQDLARVSHSTPIVVLGHIPLWTVYAAWGWGTADAERALALLRPYGSVTILNGHIHQVLQKVEGNIALHTAMSLAYPLPTPGQSGIGEPGPVTVPAGELGKMLGTRQLTVVRGKRELALVDTPLERMPAQPAMNGGG
ncbi:metallophosphoesterase family protein [Solilutibacter silvestris]|uniref:Calcineurin-like phosphoesterase n=1 Tax=Solilutibacter silvestris TaxID=1645665 RepID=A0A2K1PX85_9GAMM|nr:metallophosphoesterase [Lysobacter silvestris]PNS07408.1 Calcineurin-like phosphoesterase [Lysobacter silvestris]